jgi:Tol biopolymer transport system component
MRSSYPALVRATLTLSLTLAASAQGRKLNGPLEFTYTDDVKQFLLTPAGRVVYDGWIQDRHQLRSARLDGSAPMLVQDNDRSSSSIGGLTQDGTGTRVYWISDREVWMRMELYGAPADGSAPAARLQPALTADERVLRFTLAPDGARIAYLQRVAELNGSGQSVYRDRLFSVAATGSGAPTLVSTNSQVTDFRITPDSARVVYIGHHNDGRFELYTAPLAGGSTPLVLHAPFVTGGRLDEFQLSPDGTRAVYVADAETDEVHELYTVPVDGSAAPTKLSGVQPPGGTVYSGPHVTADSTRVTYEARNAQGTRALFVAPMSGGTPLQLGVMGNAGLHALAPDGARVAFRSGTGTTVRLYSAPLDGSAAPIELSGTLVANGWVRGTLAIAPDSSRVLYLADALHVGNVELYSVPLDGSAAPVRLNVEGPLQHEVAADFVVGPELVLFRTGVRVAQVDSLYLFSARLDGSMPARLLSSTLPSGYAHGVDAFALDPASGTVSYLADQTYAGVFELYRVPQDGSAPNVLQVGMRAHTFVTGDVHEFTPSPDGTHVVYRADEFAGRDLYVASLDMPSTRTRLDALDTPSLSGNWVVGWTPDSQRVLYRNADDAMPEPYRVIDLRSVPRDGSAEPVILSPQPRSGDVLQHACTPDSARVVFRYVKDSDFVGQLYSAPPDGSAPPLLLTPAGTVDGGVVRFELSRDGSQAVFLGARAPGVIELLRVPVDGSGPPLALNGPLASNGDVRDFALSADGTLVVYSADQDTDEVVELFVVPLAGGTPLQLNAPLVAGGDVGRFALSRDSSRVAYVADQDVNDEDELYSVLLAGGAVLELSALPASNRDVFTFLIAPDSSRVVYQADQDGNGRAELYSVPLAGGLAPVKVSGTLVTGGATLDFQLGGGRVVFRADAALDEQLALFSAPLDGSAPPTPLYQPLSSLGDVVRFQLDGDGAWVLFSVSEYASYAELYAAAVDGTGAVHHLNAPLQIPSAHDLWGVFAPDRDRVFYLANQDAAGADELYVTNALLPPSIPPHRIR